MVVVVVDVVVVELVVVVSGDVGRGIDSGPLPGVQAAAITANTVATVIVIITVRVRRTWS